MTLFYYIASNRELPTGGFGHKKTTTTIKNYVTNVNPAAKEQQMMKIMLEKYPNGDKLIDIFETEEDAAGIYIAGPITHDDYAHIFRQAIVYQVNPDGGSFKINDELKRSHPKFYQINKKCLTELFSYLSRNMNEGDEVELYSCWASGWERFTETPIKALDLVIELSTFDLESEFDWKERQYIRIIK